MESLSNITKPTVTTAVAAHFLNRKPRTLTLWSHLKKGPILPLKIGGRLAWKVSEIRELLKQ